MGLLMHGAGALETQDIEEAEVLNAFFTSVFTSKTGLQESKAPETRGQVLEYGRYTLGGRGSGQEIHKLHIRKSTALKGCNHVCRGQMSLLPSKRARRRMQGTTG